MKNYAREGLLGLTVVLSHLFLGCSNPAKVPALPPEQQFDKFTSQVNANIYVDATLSMMGFVRPGADTRYCKTIDALEGSIISGWSQATVNFFKFGDEIDSIKGRDYIRAKQVAFYKNDKINRLTRIQRVIDRIPLADMTLILTDLFQDRADVNLLTAQLKEKCFQKRLTFGIIGIRSEYNGNIYDLGPNRSAFYHRSTPGDVTTFRPFYIIIMGKYPDVMRFYENFKAPEMSGLNFEVNEFVVYSPYLASQPVSFNGAIIDSTFYLSEALNLIPYTSQDTRLKQFSIQNDSETAAFVATLPYTPAPHTILFDHNSIDIELTVTQCLPDTYFVNPLAKRAFNIAYWRITNKGLKIRAEISPALLPGDGLYLYEIVLRPRINAYKFPGWISAWDLEKASNESGYVLMSMLSDDTVNVSGADSIKAANNFASINSKRRGVGTSTLNLQRLLVDLWKTNVVIHDLYIARLYCYFKKG